MNPAVLFDLAARVAKSLAADPYINVTKDDAPAVTQIVEDKLAPVINHLTNNEPWYQSRVTWGAIITTVASLCSAFGFALAPEDIDVIVGFVTAAGTLIGAGVTLYGRWKATKPLGA